MKKFLSLLSLVATISVCFSCSKESSLRNRIEGTWGLTHYELSGKVDGEILYQYEGDCNPYAPIDSNDGKMAIINTNDNKYLLTFYSWDNRKSIWVVGETMSVSINGNKMFVEGEERSFSFQLKSDILTIEGYAEMEVDGSVLGEEGEVRAVGQSKYVFRRMNDFS